MTARALWLLRISSLAVAQRVTTEHDSDNHSCISLKSCRLDGSCLHVQSRRKKGHPVVARHVVFVDDKKSLFINSNRYHMYTCLSFA